MSPGEALTVRRYRPADVAAVWAVHERALRASGLEFVEDAPVDADLTAIRARYLDRDGEFLVGLADDRIVAIGGFRPRDDETVEIRRMRVHPDHQRRGFGRRLLTALEGRARDRGFRSAVLETNERLHAAMAFYEARGDDEAGRETHPATGDTFVTSRKVL